jgi:hypothetical protein
MARLGWSGVRGYRLAGMDMRIGLERWRVIMGLALLNITE